MKVAIAELTNDGHTGVARFALEAQRGFQSLGIECQRVLGGANALQQWTYESEGNLAYRNWFAWGLALNEFDAVFLTDLHATRHDKTGMLYLDGLAQIERPVVSYAHGNHYAIPAVEHVLRTLGSRLRVVYSDGVKNIVPGCTMKPGLGIPYTPRFAHQQMGSPGRRILFCGTVRTLKGLVGVADAAAIAGFPMTIIGGCGNHAGVSLPNGIAYMLRDTHQGTWLSDEPYKPQKPWPWKMEVNGALFEYRGPVPDDQYEDALAASDVHVNLTAQSFQPSQLEYTTLEAIDAGHTVVTQSWRADHRPWRLRRLTGFEEPVGISTKGGKFHARWGNNDRSALLDALWDANFEHTAYNRDLLRVFHDPTMFALTVVKEFEK